MLTLVPTRDGEAQRAPARGARERQLPGAPATGEVARADTNILDEGRIERGHRATLRDAMRRPQNERDGA
jgi:hypothetical protein